MEQLQTGNSKMTVAPHNSLEKPLIVAVDGPAGSGKSTICQLVCSKLGWGYVNTGSIYRAVALLAIEKHVDIEDHEGLMPLIRSLRIEGRWMGEEGRLLIGERDVTPFLNQPEVSQKASVVAKNAHIRQELLPVFRSLAETCQTQGVMVDGRDIGTVVFPEADLKIYMTASLEVRAKRRLEQLGAENCELEKIQEQMRVRDEQDISRKIAPLTRAQNAISFDTTHMKQEHVVDELFQLIDENLLQKNS